MRSLNNGPANTGPARPTPRPTLEHTKKTVGKFSKKGIPYDLLRSPGSPASLAPTFLVTWLQKLSKSPLLAPTLHCTDTTHSTGPRAPGRGGDSIDISHFQNEEWSAARRSEGIEDCKEVVGAESCFLRRAARDQVFWPTETRTRSDPGPGGTFPSLFT